MKKSVAFDEGPAIVADALEGVEDVELVVGIVIDCIGPDQLEKLSVSVMVETLSLAQITVVSDWACTAMHADKSASRVVQYFIAVAVYWSRCQKLSVGDGALGRPYMPQTWLNSTPSPCP